MTEISTAENEALVSAVYTRALQDRSEGRDLLGPEQLLYEVEMLSQEVNSGASFEQYFRWASLDEIRQAPTRFEELGLPAPARITRAAIQMAFPGGLPASEAEMDELTEWIPEQEARLALLADEFADHNGAIINALAAWYRRATGA
jgi:cell division septum initiation protein DivIVA